jgi:hypothetical protein
MLQAFYMRKPETYAQFKTRLLVLALALCFRSNESKVSIKQIIARTFTPNESFSLACVADLASAGAISFYRKEGSSIAASYSDLTYISNPRKSSTNIFEDILQIRRLLIKHDEYRVYLAKLSLQISANECVQYAKFQSIREGLLLEKTLAENQNLGLLLLTNDVNKFLMIFWRAIKYLIDQKQIITTFDQLTELAFNYYQRYMKNGAAIQRYNWPNELPMSKISQILQMLDVKPS